MKKLNLTVYYFLSIMFVELIFKLFVFKSVFNLSLIYISLFSIVVSFILTLLTKIFKKNNITFIVFLSLIGLWYATEVTFKLIFNTFFSISILGIAGQAAQFIDTTILEIFKNIFVILLMFVPLVIGIIFRKRINLERHTKTGLLFTLLYITLFIALYQDVLLFNASSSNSAYKLYHKIENNALNIENLGILSSTYLEVKRLLFGFDEELVDVKIDKTETNELQYEYNNQNIDFDTLIQNESNNTIKNMHKYFASDTGTLENEYTGIFNGKNLVFVMGESFSDLAVSEKYTPTIYKLVNSSFVFKNFYTPNNLSTLGGEFQMLTGLFANMNALTNYWRRGVGYYPYGLANVFEQEGYKTYAYHANWGSFQNRNLYLKSIGFDYFLNRNNGLGKLMNVNAWPQSDLEMINSTVNQFINNDEPFVAYYVGVSGHFPWGWNENDMSLKNRALVNDMNVREEAKAYVASNIELDKALESLIKKLEASGKLNDTVIVLVGDHYPYAMNNASINQLSTYERDSSIEINHNNLIIWNSEVNTVTIDKTCSQIDVMPTLFNLFGIDYDSRLFVGKDILSTEPGLAFFNNRSWVTDYGRYYSSSGKFVLKEGKTVDDKYVSTINNIVSNKINISKLIVENNYYSKIYK